MSSREKILQSIRQSGWEAVPMPPSFEAPVLNRNKVEQFILTIQAIGAECIEVNGMDQVSAFYHALIEQGLLAVNCIKEMREHNSDKFINQAVEELEKIGYVFVKAVLAVAENGAVWVTQKELVNRLLPFICEHLVMVVEAKDIVQDMHAAYQKIKIDEEGYGVFIAGPSKTADIEQSLVIGAHGPISMKMFVLK
ncbi:MAG TPA: LUD domain-containing protein [Flavisolibacter sp.]|nr:LUD domain-containing protein [Flavisolibacter sp.]